jgi:hypothetical protein
MLSLMPADAYDGQTGRCEISDFEIEGFKPTIYDDCRATPCPALSLTGKLKNKCLNPAGAQVKITAEDAEGNVIDTIEGWPASIRNIRPGDTYSFNLGPLMRYRPEMKTFHIEIIDVKTWR